MHDYSPSGRITLQLTFPDPDNKLSPGRYGEVGQARMPPPAAPGAVPTGTPTSARADTGGRPSKPESGNGLVLRVTHHKYAAPPIVSTAGTVKSLAGGDSFVSTVPAGLARRQPHAEADTVTESGRHSLGARAGPAQIA